jgi:hypothetical protein
VLRPDVPFVYLEILLLCVLPCGACYFGARCVVTKAGGT